MCRIEVSKTFKGKFRVLVNGIQEGVEVQKSAFANSIALKLKDRYPQATVIPYVEYDAIKPQKNLVNS
jgi:hypothetical protein